MSEDFFDKVEDDFITFEELKTLLLRMLPSESDSLELAKYYYENMIREVKSQRDAKCYIICRRDHDTDEKGVEFVGEHRLILAPMCFPLSKDYHHERQSIILTLGALELEVLLPNILDPKRRTGEITKVIANLETETEPEMETNHISLSYKIHVEHGTTRDVLEEYIECASI